ncbi:MAG: bifunctional nuclease family protein [Bacteroidetes bacterium]|mgnify:CR=1 FL=1|nr:bifunctional nuclease family protein [Bacteroidota bacterium]
MTRVELDIYGIAPSQIKGSYSLILSETNGDRKLPIIVGQFEAQAIAIPLEGINTERPLTHDLFVVLGKKLNFTVSEVFIHQLKEGVFYASLICETMEEKITIDCRTSDAIAIAVRYNCPIFTTEDIMDQAGIVLEESELEKPGRDKSDEPPVGSEKNLVNKYKGKTIEELEQMLDEALRHEDYLKAAQIRDEIDKRK